MSKCDFIEIYNRLNIGGGRHLPLLMPISYKTREPIIPDGTGRKITGACNNPNNVQVFPDKIIVNETVSSNVVDEHGPDVTIQMVPIYFVVFKEHNHLPIHAIMFVYFDNTWYSIGIAECNMGQQKSIATILTPDNIVRQIDHQHGEFKVFDFGILTPIHLERLKQFESFITDSHYNTSTKYYTFNLNKTYQIDNLKQYTDVYSCARFVWFIFQDSIVCGNQISLRYFETINNNYINCNGIRHNMYLSDFKLVREGSSSIINHARCSLLSILWGAIGYGGKRTMNRRHRTKRYRSQVKQKKYRKKRNRTTDTKNMLIKY